MGFFFNCLILGHANIFKFNIGNKYTNNNNVVTNLNDLTILNFKEILFQKSDDVKFEVQDFKSMNIWNVDVNYPENKLKNIFTEEDIEKKLKGKKMESSNLLINYYQKDNPTIKENLHIIIVPIKTNQFGLSYIFIDSSIFYTYGGITIQRQEGMNYKCEYNDITYDYGILIRGIQCNQKLGSNPFIAGSKADLLRVKNENYNLKVFDKNAKNYKKRISHFLILKISKFIYQNNPGTLVLVIDDNSDYYETILEALNYKWKVNIWYWNTNQDLHPSLRLSSSFRNNDNISFNILDGHYKSFTYGYGAYSTNNRIKKLDIINGKAIRNQVLWDLFVKNKLFFWFYRENETIHLYFNTQDKLNNAKKLLEDQFVNLEMWERSN